MASTSRVKSAERTLEVLGLLARADRPLSTLEIARAVDMPKSTSHHLLNVMAEHRFLEYRSDLRMWTLGVASLEIGAAYQRNGALTGKSQRYLQALTSQTGLTSHLAVLQGPDVVYLDKREPPVSGIRLVTEVGTRLPAHLTAVGRAILSRMSSAQIVQLYDGYSWPVRTGSSVHSLEDLNDLLEGIRETSVAFESDSTTLGISCIASPVTGATSDPLAAIGIAYLSVTQTEESESRMSAVVRDTAGELSGALRLDQLNN